MVKNLLATAASWRTTVVGILQALAITCGVVINAIDLDPSTIADWNKVIIAVVGLLSSIGLWQAQDAKLPEKK